MGACGLLTDRTVPFPVDLLRRSNHSASTASRRPIPNGLHPLEQDFGDALNVSGRSTSVR